LFEDYCRVSAIFPIVLLEEDFGIYGKMHILKILAQFMSNLVVSVLLHLPWLVSQFLKDSAVSGGQHCLWRNPLIEDDCTVYIQSGCSLIPALFMGYCTF
jgi:hypothetical protein